MMHHAKGSKAKMAKELICARKISCIQHDRTMPVSTSTVSLRSKGENDMVDITGQVADVIKKSEIRNGVVTIFVSGSTAAVTTIEHEPGLRKDFPRMLERTAPKNIDYEHDKTWHDGNGHSHVRASLIGPSLTVPFQDKRLMLGTWQQIVLLEMDIRPREREIVLQMIGDQ
jgi:secondary thiamine-phosphate synthase enzyme